MGKTLRKTARSIQETPEEVMQRLNEAVRMGREEKQKERAKGRKARRRLPGNTVSIRSTCGHPLKVRGVDWPGHEGPKAMEVSATCPVCAAVVEVDSVPDVLRGLVEVLSDGVRTNPAELGSTLYSAATDGLEYKGDVLWCRVRRAFVDVSLKLLEAKQGPNSPKLVDILLLLAGYSAAVDSVSIYERAYRIGKAHPSDFLDDRNFPTLGYLILKYAQALVKVGRLEEAADVYWEALDHFDRFAEMDAEWIEVGEPVDGHLPLLERLGRTHDIRTVQLRYALIRQNAGVERPEAWKKWPIWGSK